MAGQQRRDIEFRCTVKTVLARGGIAAKKTIDPNDCAGGMSDYVLGAKQPGKLPFCH